MSLLGRLIKAFRTRLAKSVELRGDTSSAGNLIADTVSFKGHPPDAPTPDSRVLLEALTGLPDDQQAVASLHYIEGKPLDEIANLLGLSSEEAALRLHLALKALRATLHRTGQNDEH